MNRTMMTRSMTRNMNACDKPLAPSIEPITMTFIEPPSIQEQKPPSTQEPIIKPLLKEEPIEEPILKPIDIHLYSYEEMIMILTDYTRIIVGQVKTTPQKIKNVVTICNLINQFIKCYHDDNIKVQEFKICCSKKIALFLKEDFHKFSFLQQIQLMNILCDLTLL
jgi:hypothetical protein